MTEKFLHNTDIRSAGKQVSRKRVTKGVGRDFDSEVGSVGNRTDDEPGVLPRHPLSSSTKEKRRSRCPTSRKNRPGTDQVGIDRGAGVASERHNSLLATFAEQPNDV